MLRIRPFYKLFFFLLVLIPAILSRAQYQPPQFNLTDAGLTGISFSNDLQEDEERNVLQYQYFYNGGGVCAGDVNNDGLAIFSSPATMSATACISIRGTGIFRMLLPKQD